MIPSILAITGWSNSRFACASETARAFNVVWNTHRLDTLFDDQVYNPGIAGWTGVLRRATADWLRVGTFPERMADMPEATWKPHEKHGRLTTQSDLPDSVYAFPKQRKEPLTDAQHVRNAVARFDQVTDVSAADRALAFANIEKAANYYGVNLAETSWHDLGVHPQKNRKQAAAKGAATRARRAGS